MVGFNNKIDEMYNSRYFSGGYDLNWSVLKGKGEDKVGPKRQRSGLG